MDKECLHIGTMARGKRNLITDVPGVLVGHQTVDKGSYHSGVTILVPGTDNPFVRKYIAACHVINGFGKTLGLVQVEELGEIETPIALTNTLSVGTVHNGILSLIIERCKREHVPVRSINPVVCECNDGQISDITQRIITEEDVLAAYQQARQDFELGSIGAGRGTICYGLKGGIGSASRVMSIDGRQYTLGVLVQTNYGASRDLRVASIPDDIQENDQGSIIILVATDLPVDARQLKRIIKRCSVGMARLGSYIGHGSGEVIVGFTTASRVRVSEHVFMAPVLEEGELNIPFRAAGEACEEAILRSMLHAKHDCSLQGKEIYTLTEYLNGNSGK